MENKPQHSEARFFEEMSTAAMLENSAPVAGLLAEGMALAMNEELDGALEFFVKASVEQPTSFYAWFCRGYAELSLMMHEEAEVSFLRAKELDPKNISTRYWLAHTHFLRDFVEEAVGELKEIIAEAPDFVEAYYDCGVGFQIMGRYDDALEIFRRRIVISPDFDTYLMMAMTYEYQKNLEKAADFYARALELEPDNIMVIEAHGATCLELGRLEEAMSDFQFALEIDPESPDALYGRGHTFFRMEKIQEAKRDLLRVVELDPDSALAWSMLGQLALYDEDFSLAIRLLKKALEVDEDILVSGFLGQAHMGMEDYEEAVRYFILALEFEPEEADYYAQRGVALFFLKRFEEAIRDFNAAEEKDSGWDDFSLRGIAHSELLNFESAVKDISRGIQLSPENVDLYLYRAEAFCSLEKTAEAQKDIQTVMSLAEKAKDEKLAEQCGKFLKEIQRMEGEVNG